MKTTENKKAVSVSYPWRELAAHETTQAGDQWKNSHGDEHDREWETESRPGKTVAEMRENFGRTLRFRRWAAGCARL